MEVEDQTTPRPRQNPTWLAGHGGDTRAAHQANVDLIERYLAELRVSGRGLPANTLRPFKYSMELIAEESGVKLISLTRRTSKCRQIIEAALKDKGKEGDEGYKRAIPVKVRMKDRVRPVYSIDEMINIATAVFQAECELARMDHRPKCKQAEALLMRVARTSANGLANDCGEAIKSAQDEPGCSDDDRILLSEIDAILSKATRGDLELATFHGRLKLEAAFRGFGVGAIANFSSAATQTVINWGSGLKSPTRMFVRDIPKIEAAIELPAGYLSDTHISHRSGPSNVKHYHLPPEVLAMSASKQKEFRRLVDPTINLRSLPQDEVEALMQKTLEILEKSRKTDDVKRAKLRLEMPYALKELPPHLAEEFKALVLQRRDVLLMSIVPNKKRGWDDDTIEFYHLRFRLFFGWLHHCMGVALEHLSLAYLAFPQILNEYMLHLVERKEDVGLKKGFSAIAREWYIFAASLTRERLGGSGGSNRYNYDDDDDDNDYIDGGEPVGWLRTQHGLLDRLGAISIPRRRDELDFALGKRGNIRQVLISKTIEKAKLNWSACLDETSKLYRSWRKEHEGNQTDCESTARVAEILTWEYPLDAIKFGVQQLGFFIERQRVGRFRWATAVRGSSTLKLHAQLPLRRKTFCALTYHPDNSGMIRFVNGEWWVVIPEGIFKNEGTKAFNKFVVDGFFRKRIIDEWGLYQDLATYVEIARSTILSGAESPAFYVARGNSGHVSPGTFASEFRLLTRDYIAENPGTGTGLPGVRDFGSHAMRHLVATAVWKKTGSLHAAAAAIHDSEEVTARHYRKIVEDEAKQCATMSEVLAGEANGPVWPKYGNVLPRIPSPPSAPAVAALGSDINNVVDENR